MKRIHLASALVVLVTFLLGAAAGAGVHAWGAPHRRPPHGGRGGPPHYLRELHLTEAQQQQAAPIFTKHRAAIDAVMRESFPKMRELNDAMEVELAPLLTVEQQQRLEEVKARPPPPPPWMHEKPPAPP